VIFLIPEDQTKGKSTMRIKTLILLAVSVVFAVALLGCGAEQTQTETPATQAEAQPATAEAYPIDFCVVSGEKLGSMGDPVEYNYNGRMVKFCCGGCIETFESAPAMYIAKLDSAAAGMSMPGDMEGHEGHNH
jgi:YHS domain-containing protein